jgi:replication factor A1
MFRENGEAHSSCYRRSPKSNARLFIILALRVLSTNEDKIGNPVAIPNREDSSAVERNTTVADPSASSSGPRIVPQPQQQPQQQQQEKKQQASSGRSGQQHPILPIEGLSPYQNNWTIKARATQKSDIRTWSNQRGEGKLFNVTFMDESGEIKATGFNTVVDELYQKLEEGKVYFVSKARVGLAKKKFSHLPNDYEIILDRTTEIDEVC